MTANYRFRAAACALAAGVCLIASVASAQSAQPAGAEGLAPMIPSEAFFYVERRGHQAVRKAFVASNLGKMAADEAIKQFVKDSRIRIEEKIAEGMFDLESPEEIAKYQKLLHDVLRPFWHNPSAMYLVFDDNFENSPGLGFISVTGKYRDSCRESLTAIMKVGVAAQDQQGKRHMFTYKKGSTIWQGVASHYREFKLPKDPNKLVSALDGKTVFMTCWLNDILVIACKLPAADAMSRMLSLAKPAKGKDANSSLQVVMKKTELKDWAFRWYLDAEAIRKAINASADEDFGPLPEVFAILGIDTVRGIGGTGGYVDNVYARKTYVYAPGVKQGLIRTLKQGGSYEKALAMIPDTSSMFLAGQFDGTAIVDMIQRMVELQVSSQTRAEQRRARRMKRMMEDRARAEAATRPGTRPTRPMPTTGVPLVATTRAASRPTTQIPEEARKVLAQIKALVEASDGNLGGFTTAIGPPQMMMGGVPLGLVLGLKDRDKAVRAINELIKLTGLEGGAEDEDEDLPEGRKKPTSYRGVAIRSLGDMLRMAVLKDRVVIGLSDNATKLAIDAALDKSGGFPAGSKAEALARLCGKGPGIFHVDLSAISKAFWPFLMKLVEEEPEDMFLASLPSVAKMARMLGPEIAVFKPDADGVLMDSRGKIPFATKFLLAYPLLMFGFMF